jgi:protoporphyrin/coproporphyrin ferrochelatase
MISNVKSGILLVNLGTPDAPDTSSVRRYLRQFLMDPFVIDIPALARWALVHLLILPRRPQASAEAYRKIWISRGSPLLYHTRDLTQKVASLLGPLIPVRFGMRYGSPSLETAIEELHQSGVNQITALPLYPQYSLAATESSVVELKRVIGERHPEVALRILPAFYADPGFVRSFVESAREALKDFRHDHIVFSFHGLPERHVKKTDATGAHCLASSDCCARIDERNRDCYRAQCFHSAREIAAGLGLKAADYSIGFQSRLGRTPWIKPYTDLLYPELAARGVKRIAVLSPSFVADCLETLEEIQLRGREQFIACGGEDLKLVPSLNSRDDWAQAVAKLVTAGP